MIEKEYFTTRFSYDDRRENVWKRVAHYLKRYIPANATVLDLGAGYCSFINNVEAKEKHALDIFTDLKKYAAQGVQCHVQSSTHMPSLKTSHFDIVFASNFFEHLSHEDAQKTLSEIKRILKKNGRLIIIQPNFKYSYREYYDDYTHVATYTEVSLCDFLSSEGFTVMECIPRFLPFSVKSRFSFLYFLIPLYLRLPYRPLAKQMLVVVENKKQ
jgi:ubiquinone/menaquinone biosynthesis C-methylase UbiE